MIRLLHVFFYLCLFSASQLGLATSFLYAEEASASSFEFLDPMTVDLIHEEETLYPGHPFWVAVRLKIAPDWHAYWVNPGNTGMPISVDWTLPEGFTAAPIAWPFPHRLTSDYQVGFVYEGDVWLLAQITPPAILSSQEFNIGANVKWVVCSDQNCVPGQAEANAKIPVSSDKQPKRNAKWNDAFIHARTKIPQPHSSAIASRKQAFIELTLELPDGDARQVTGAYFCSKQNQIIDDCIDAILTLPTDGNSSRHRLYLKHTLSAESDTSKTDTLKGVVVLLGGKEKKEFVCALEIDTAILDTTSQAPKATLDGDMISYVAPGEGLPKKEMTETDSLPTGKKESFEGGLGMALLLAFAGGVILNLMPCVLPVISFKILSFVKLAGQSRALIFAHGLAFSAGVVASFWILAGALITLQSYGHVVGWGFQLQEPLFVAVLAAVLLIFSLSLFGVFEAGISLTSIAGQAQHTVSGKSGGLFGSFCSGILATAVATPCTGPFLGSAIGFAVTLSPPLALLVFTSLGIGMAFPYLLLSAYPQYLRFLPKPGAWMIAFRELMGFVMLATVLWLLWVFGAQTNSFAIVVLLAGFFCFAFGCWIYGKWGSFGSKKGTRILSYAFSLICFVAGAYTLALSTAATGGSFYENEVASYSEQASSHSGSSRWEKFSPERVRELQEQGIPVLVDFTAKWCLICQLNHLAFSNEGVNQKIAELGIVKMKADWTKNDPIITQELQNFGRNGVPLYLLYGRDKTKAPEILPQVLTPDIILNYLQNVSS